jgi:hypothetical protein
MKPEPLLASLIGISLCLMASGNPLDAADYDLYYLGGQSNMDGFGKTSELPADLQQPLEGVMIFHGHPAPDQDRAGGEGLWTPLRPGHGFGFASDGKTNSYSDRFGVELSFARLLREENPERKIAIIKYSRGGTSIDQSAARDFGCWEPDFHADGPDGEINQYDHFLATIQHARSVKDIDGDGEDDRLVPRGILWMQGESDASITPEVAQRYEANLKRLMDLLRAALWDDGVPVAVGRISDSGQDPNDKKIWDHGDIVRQAQAGFVQKDGRAVLVTSTDEYGYSDPYHYDSAGYLDLGKQFAEALREYEQARAN